MHRKRVIVGVLGVGCLGLMAWLLGVATGSASGQVKAQRTTRVTIVTVTAGKPSELGFKFSKSSALPAGTITFKVKNAGLGTHNFKICTSPVTTSAKNSCVGKATKMLKAGESATLTVTLTKSGKYEFLCAVPGHAAAGMKGLLGVGVSVSASASASGSTSASGSSSTTTGSSTAGNTTGGGAGAGGGGTPGANDIAAGCPAGQTILGGGGDGDGDDVAAAPDDGDGCL
jgi:uncharacterized cupredoxin-like copper-binding protein